MTRADDLREKLVGFIENRWEKIQVPFRGRENANDDAVEAKVKELIRESLKRDFAPIALEIVAAIGTKEFDGVPPPPLVNYVRHDGEMERIAGPDTKDGDEAGRRILAWGAWAQDWDRFDRARSIAKQFADWGEIHLVCKWQPKEKVRRAMNQIWYDFVLKAFDKRKHRIRDVGAKRKRGPKRKHDPKKDDKLLGDWAAAKKNGAYKAKWCAERGIDPKEISRAQGRRRARRARAKR